jgi:hypothetical protein
MVSLPVYLRVRPPSAAQTQTFFFTVRQFFMWGSLSDERMGMLFTVPAGSHDYSVLSLIRDSPNLEDRFPIFISHVFQG